MQPKVHFDPDKTTAFTAEKDAFRLLFATAAVREQSMRRLDIKYAFTTETFAHDKLTFVR